MKKIRDWIAAIVVSGACAVSAATQAPGDDTRPRTDYVTAAQGAWLVSISFTGAETGPRRSHAFETYDGLATPRAMLYSASPEAELSLVYDLPALTSFDRFAVPEVNEVPSAGVTFFREVRVFGSTDDAETGYELIAQATLQTHARSGETTELEIVSQHPIRFLKLVLRGGIQDLQEQMTYEWSELIGNGSQDAVPLEGGFTGVWNTQLPDIDRSAGLIQLKQQGIAVTGCYGGRDITGTVSGSILRASGVGRSDGTPSQHVMLLDHAGALRGAISTNNGPFGLFGGPLAPDGSTPDCSDIPEPELGCGSTVYVQFGFDSADLRPEAEPVLSELYTGLSGVSGRTIVIEGHTSSEGSADYNQGLSERRAQTVVAALVIRGLASGSISAVGKGESVPIASNNTEIGRSLNRRVEVQCTD